MSHTYPHTHTHTHTHIHTHAQATRRPARLPPPLPTRQRVRTAAGTVLPLALPPPDPRPPPPPLSTLACPLQRQPRPPRRHSLVCFPLGLENFACLMGSCVAGDACCCFTMRRVLRGFWAPFLAPPLQTTPGVSFFTPSRTYSVASHLAYYPPMWFVSPRGVLWVLRMRCGACCPKCPYQATQDYKLLPQLFILIYQVIQNSLHCLHGETARTHEQLHTFWHAHTRTRTQTQCPTSARLPRA